MQVELPSDVSCVIELPAGAGEPQIIQGRGEVEKTARDRWQVRVKDRTIRLAAAVEDS